MGRVLKGYSNPPQWPKRVNVLLYIGSEGSTAMRSKTERTSLRFIARFDSPRGSRYVTLHTRLLHAVHPVH